MSSSGLRPGAVLQGTYEIVRLIGAGGMGEVYEARHRRLSGRYAVKMLLQAITAEPEALARFHREAAITSGLRHPNIVQVIDFDQTRDGIPYLVMEYLEGGPLDVRVPPGARLPLNQVVWVVNQVASALAAAHSHGVVHRDLKPQNIYLVKIPGQRKELVKILDFGISKVRSAATALTRSASVLGTPQYMAPEQTERPDAVDARADQFALAAITYQLITGAFAFSGETLAEVLHQVLYAEPGPMTIFEAGVSPRVEEVVRVGLAKQPGARFSDVLEFSQALERAAGLEENDDFARSEASSIGRGPPTWSPSRPAKGAETLWYGSREQATPPPISPSRAALTIDALEDLRAVSPSRRKPLLLASAAVVLALGSLAIARLVHRPPAPTAAPVAAEQPRAAPLEALAPALVEQVQIDVASAPAGVQVTVDGVVEDLPVHLARNRDIHVLRFEAPGYEPRELKVSGAKSRTLTIHLHRRKAAALPDAAPASPGSWADPFTEGAYSRERKPAPRSKRGGLANPF